MKFFKILFFLSILFLANSVFARVDDYVAEANTIKNILEESIKSYEKGDNLKAKKLSEDAYFQHFENMEGPIGRNIEEKLSLWKENLQICVACIKIKRP